MAASFGNSNALIPDKNRILEHCFTEAKRSNFNAVLKWTNWKEDHEKLKKTLQNLPDKLAHPGVIPFGSRALVKANVVHTNEILSCVGDQYFIKQSAKQAIDMCDRRIKESERMLEHLEKECKLLESRQTLPKAEEVFASEDQEEIVEEYDEEKEIQWRAYHREMEKKYHQELAELRKKREEEGPVQTEDDIFQRLDLLELEEELNDELERLNDASDSDESDGGSSEESEGEEKGEKQDSQEKDLRKGNNQLPSITTNSRNTTLTENNITTFEGFQKVLKNSPVLKSGQVTYGFTDEDGNEWQKPVVTHIYGEENSELSALHKSRKSVSFASDAEDSDTDVNEDVDSNIIIKFKHSDKEFQESPPNQTTVNGVIIHINSPKDIYRQFAHYMSSCKPKSILKKNSYEGEPSTSSTILHSTQCFGTSLGHQWQDDDVCVQDSSQPARDLSHLPVVLKDVSEMNPSEVPLPQPQVAESTRRISRFKASRAASQGHR